MELETMLQPEEIGNIYGWEHSNDPRIIEAIKRGILAGDVIPMVYLERVASGNTYQIINHKTGGHSRLLAHYQLNLPVTCVVLGEAAALHESAVQIKDIKLKEDDEAYQIARSGYKGTYRW
jgi:hypothetical protein